MGTEENNRENVHGKEELYTVMVSVDSCCGSVVVPLDSCY